MQAVCDQSKTRCTVLQSGAQSIRVKLSQLCRAADLQNPEFSIIATHRVLKLVPVDLLAAECDQNPTSKPYEHVLLQVWDSTKKPRSS